MWKYSEWLSDYKRPTCQTVIQAEMSVCWWYGSSCCLARSLSNTLPFHSACCTKQNSCKGSERRTDHMSVNGDRGVRWHRAVEHWAKWKKSTFFHTASMMYEGLSRLWQLQGPWYSADNLFWVGRVSGGKGVWGGVGVSKVCCDINNR